MSLKCYFQFDSGRFCKKIAMNGSRFCNNHQPRGAASEGQFDPHGWPQLHPHVRLATPNDLFDLVRETLLGARTGSVTPSQAFAISSLATVWLRVYEEMVQHQRIRALNRQILPTLVDAESSATAEREAELAADAGHRAATDPAPLVPHDPWAPGRMAGPVRSDSPASVHLEAVADSGRAPSNGQPAALGPVPVPSRTEPAATALSASAAPSAISHQSPVTNHQSPESVPASQRAAATADVFSLAARAISSDHDSADRAAANAELEALVAARLGEPLPPGSAASKPNGRGHD